MGIKNTLVTFGRFIKRCFHYVSVGNPNQIFRDIRSWWHFRHQAWRDVLYYDEENKRYRLERHTLTMREITPVDLAVTGQKYHYFYTDLQPPERHEKRVVEDEDGNKHEYLNTSAASNYLYMINNDINDAMAGTFKNSALNPKVIVGLIVGGIILAVMFFVFKG